MITEDDWRDLGKSRPTRHRLVGRRVAPGSPVYIGLDYHGHRHALIPIDSLEAAVTDEKSRGLTASGQEFELEGQPLRPFLDLACHDQNAHPMFDLVVEEIHRRLVQGALPAPAVIETLEHWRRFWGKTPRQHLSDEQIRGLFGELWFLRVWLLRHTVDNVVHWVGPKRGNHDFVWPDKAVEVKTTLSTRHAHIVHGLDQLQPPENGPLYLFSMRLKDDPSSGNTLVSLIESITSALESHPAVLTAFEERLVDAEYSPGHAHIYREMRYRVVEERLYAVGLGFPNLTSAAFVGGRPPAGIEGVSYTINLDVCPDLLVSTDPASAVLM